MAHFTAYTPLDPVKLDIDFYLSKLPWNKASLALDYTVEND